MIEKIRYLKREEIHDKKWNGCVHFGFNGFPYGYTWYLDQIAEFWDGIVYNDYEAVLPLVRNKKWGYEYLYQPLFAQQLGIFSLSELPQKICNSMWECIPEEIKFIEIQTNEFNNPTKKDFELTERKNYVLGLNHTYENLSKKYSGNLKRNLKKAVKSKLFIKPDTKPELFVEFFEKNIAGQIAEYKREHHFRLLRLIYHSRQFNVGNVYQVLDEHNEICAATFVLFNQNRIINLVPVSNEQGRKTGAMSYLLDYLIRININRVKVFDFEGSMIPSIAKFNKGFGAKEVNYWQIKRNQLPWFARIIKR